MEEKNQNPISPDGQNPDPDKVLDALVEFREEFNDAIEHEKSLSENFWNSLSSEEKLWTFCAVMRRLQQGELEEGRSYRGILYTTFGWGPEAYVPAQCSGFLDIHNSIHTSEDLAEIVESVVNELGMEADSDRIQEIIFKRHY